MHLTQYLELSDWEGTGSPIAWTYMGFATKLSLSVRISFRVTRVDRSSCPSHADWTAYVRSNVYFRHSVSKYAIICVDLNSARWNLDEASKERRSRVFWQTFTQDTWLVSICAMRMSAVRELILYVHQSFGFGRPPSIIPSFVDCGFPKDLDEYTNIEGGKEMGCKYKSTLTSHD